MALTEITALLIALSAVCRALTELIRTIRR
jgi:hypothetical protein